uniref:Lipase_3 domain-containing protein n=1 Tax=Macrostomum lignano TaxID=282301 RepID=A0A1I8I061_9PLAT
MYRQYQNSVKAAAAAEPSPPATKCSHPEDRVRFHMVRDGCYDHGQYDYSFAAECKDCQLIFATGQSLNGDIQLKRIRGEQDWFRQRRISDTDFYFQGWLEMFKIDYDEVRTTPEIFEKV